MSLATDILLVVVGGAALWYGADRFVASAVALARWPVDLLGGP